MSPQPPTWLSTAETAEYLGLSEDSVRRLVNERQLKAHVFGRLWRFKLTDIQDFISRSVLDPGGSGGASSPPASSASCEAPSSTNDERS